MLVVLLCCVVVAVACSAAQKSIGVVGEDNIGRFVVVSDFHYDPYLGSNPPVPSDAQFGMDSPLWLINKTIYSLADVVNQQGGCDFILITGDMTAHLLADIEDPSKATNYFVDVMSTQAKIFSTAFAGSSQFVTSPVLSIGNNDLYPKYAAPGATPGWLASFADNWPSITYSNASRASFLASGSFAVDIPTSLGKAHRVISLHTNYWSAYNTYTTSDNDPSGIFQFLRDELAAAKQQGIRVYIIGHIPPGIDQYDGTEMWQDRFVTTYVDIVTPYLGNTVMGQLYGHEHVSLIHMFGAQTTGDANTAGPVQFHSSISPYYDNYPSFRMYTYNRDTLQMLDYADWYMNIAAATPEYQLLFSSARSTYKLSGLDTNGYCEFISNMYHNATLADTYIHNSLLPAPSVPKCNEMCRELILCNTQFLHLNDYTACVDKKQHKRLACVKSNTGRTSVVVWMIAVVVMVVLETV